MDGEHSSTNGEHSVAGVYPTNGEHPVNAEHTNGQHPVKAEHTNGQNPTQDRYPQPLKLSGILDEFESFHSTPCIGTEFPKANLAEWLKAPNSDQLIRDLAITSIVYLIAASYLDY